MISETLASQTLADDWRRREALLLAPYAMHGVDSAGRRHPEPSHPYRSPFQRDRDRIVHSAAYRRLSAKMQVFTREMGDYPRTRLTHTLEVASVSRTLARALQLNEDLVEALALQHDIGHPPYGHAGEDVLDECLQSVGGFSHNRQALRIVEQLEQRYPEFPGLNLSLEVLEGQQYRCPQHALAQTPLLEVQLVDAADSVAYNTHDADDSLKLGLLTLAELSEVPLWNEAVRRVRQRFADLQGEQLKHAVLHELLDWQVSDLVKQTQQRIAALGIETVETVRASERVVVASSEVAEQKRAYEQFLITRVYRHPEILRLRYEAQAELRALFDGYCRSPKLMPPSFQARLEEHGVERTVGDYLAGMTDRFAQQQFQKLFGST